MMYPAEVTRENVSGHWFWGIKSKKLKGCVAQGDTIEESMREFEDNEREWINTAPKFGIKVPKMLHNEDFEKEND